MEEEEEEGRKTAKREGGRDEGRKEGWFNKEEKSVSSINNIGLS